MTAGKISEVGEASEVIVQKDQAIFAQADSLLVQFFQVGGKTHEAAILAAVRQGKGMA